MTSASLRRVLPECSTSFLVSEVDRHDRIEGGRVDVFRLAHHDLRSIRAGGQVRTSVNVAADHAEMTDDAHQRRDR